MLKLVKLRSGKVLKIDLNAHGRRWIIGEVIYADCYFPVGFKQDFHLNPTDTVIDVGANVGVFSLYAATLAPKGRIYAFEPVKSNFKNLEKHIALNNIHNVIIENVGISDKKKRARIYLTAGNSGGHSTNKNKAKALHEVLRGTEMVEMVSLKSVFDKNKIKRCNFLKMDCEGEEGKILYALPSSYFKRIDKIALEFHPGVNDVKLAHFLKKQGFRISVNGLGDKMGMIYASK